MKAHGEFDSRQVCRFSSTSNDPDLYRDCAAQARALYVGTLLRWPFGPMRRVAGARSKVSEAHSFWRKAGSPQRN